MDKITRQCPQTFWRERRAEAVSNRGPSAYQPNALPLGQTGSHLPLLLLLIAFIQHHSLLSSSLSAHAACNSNWMTLTFYSPFRKIDQSGVLTALLSCYMAGATRSCCRLGARSVYTIQPCTSLQSHFVQSHMCRMHMCVDVTCHLRFWQNGRDVLLATLPAYTNKLWILCEFKYAQGFAGLFVCLKVIRGKIQHVSFFPFLYTLSFSCYSWQSLEHQFPLTNRKRVEAAFHVTAVQNISRLPPNMLMET